MDFGFLIFDSISQNASSQTGKMLKYNLKKIIWKFNSYLIHYRFEKWKWKIWKKYKAKNNKKNIKKTVAQKRKIPNKNKNQKSNKWKIIKVNT